MMTKPRVYFPVMSDGEGCPPTTIPWEIIEPHRDQAMLNHDQTLEMLAYRGGLGYSELIAVLEDRSWARMDPKDSNRRLRELLKPVKIIR